MDGTMGVRLSQRHTGISGLVLTYLATGLIETNVAGFAYCDRGCGVERLDVEGIAVLGLCGTSRVADFSRCVDVLDPTSSDR